ncbi:YolD-like family protein [Bacillus sp. 1P02SD]|uniref:YolD-like family protein n=1 Tax=Bacillus sp. 1P02SD TaxID=3132264 RepID=UPI0039A2420F
MIRDRGIMKWQGFFIPEQIKLLKDSEREDLREKQPLIDVQKIVEMNEIVAEAMEYNLTLTFKVYNKQFGCFEFINGNVHYIDTNNKQLKIINQNEELHQLPFNLIVDIYRD